MILRTIYCLIFISTTFSFILNGQDHQKIDSLQQLLKVPSIDLHTEADIYTQLSKLLIAHYPDSSYIYVTKALALAIELEDTYLMCKTYTNSSLMDINHARYESAINKLNKADSLTYKIDTIKHDPNDILKGRKVILQNRSIAFQYLNDIESSIRDNLESLKICETIKDSFGISLQYFNLAHAHNSLDNKIRTKKYLDQALRMARKINYPFVISGSLIFKCSLLTEEQKLDSIKIYALEALEIANQNNNFQIE